MPDKKLTPEQLARNQATVRHIPEWLHYLGVTQRALAERLNMSEPHISKWLSGKTTMSTAQFQQIAEVLGITWEELRVSPKERRRGHSLP